MAGRGGLRPSGGSPLGCFVSFVSLATLALATSCRHPGIPRVAPETHLVGAGVTLSIRPPPSTSTPIVRSGVVPVWVTVANRGRTPLQIRYRDFALSDDLMTDGALLPSELGVAPGTGELLPEGTLASGASASGFLYFRLPARRPSNLRVDLEAADAQTIARGYLELRFD